MAMVHWGNDGGAQIGACDSHRSPQHRSSQHHSVSLPTLYSTAYVAHVCGMRPMSGVVGTDVGTGRQRRGPWTVMHARTGRQRRGSWIMMYGCMPACAAVAVECGEC